MGRPSIPRTKTIYALVSAVVLLLLSGCETNSSLIQRSEIPSYTAIECLSENEGSRLKQQAKAGDAEAQFQLGAWYLSACGGRDSVKTAEWYELSAEQGHEEAQYRLANMYSQGSGVAKDVGRGEAWYRAAAGQGHITAARTLGDIYYEGKDVPRDLDEAEKWYRLAIELGDVHSQYKLDKTVKEKDPVAWERKEQERIALEEEHQRQREEEEAEQRRKDAEQRRLEAQPYAQKAMDRFGSVSVSVIEDDDSKGFRSEVREKLESLPNHSVRGSEVSGGEVARAILDPETLANFGPYSPIAVLTAVIIDQANEDFKNWNRTRKDKAKVKPAIAALTEAFAQADPEKGFLTELHATAVRQQAPGLLISDSENTSNDERYRLVVRLDQLKIFHAPTNKRMGRLWVAADVKLSGQQGAEQALQERICYMSSDIDLLWVAKNAGEEFSEQLNKAYRNLSNRILSQMLGLAPDPDAPSSLWTAETLCEQTSVSVKVAGGHYTGEMKDGKREGYGEMRYAKGKEWVTVYRGHFVNDKEHGDGRCKWRSGGWSMCTFVNGERRP